MTISSLVDSAEDRSVEVVMDSSQNVSCVQWAATKTNKILATIGMDGKGKAMLPAYCCGVLMS